MVHEVGDAWDRARRHAQRRDVLRLRLRRGRHGDRRAKVGVVGEAHGHAARGRRLDRADHELLGVRAEVQVVERHVEGLLRLPEEAGDELRDLDRLLAAVRERPG